MTDTNLDPATLSATVREMFPPPPPLVGWLGFYYDSSKDAPEDAGWYCSGKVHPDREEALCELAGFRPFEGSALVEVGQASALSAPATEKVAKVECPNCGEMTSESHADGILFGAVNYTCQPAPPEPAAPEMPEAVCVNTFRLEELLKYADLAEVALRTGFHPPEFLFTPADRSLRQCIDAIKEERDKRRTHSQPQSEELNKAFDQGYEKGVLDEANRRTHSQPVAHPFKAGFKPDSMRHFAEYVRDNWHYFGTDTAGLAHQFLQEMAAQPVAVGMTEELEHILSIAERDLRYKEECFEDSARTEPDERIERLRAAIAAVRQQAAQGRKVELPKVRELIGFLKIDAHAEFFPQLFAKYEPMFDAALAELDATEGRE